MPTEHELKRFGIHSKTGVDIASPKQKPNQYKLVEIIGEKEVTIATAFVSQYAVLVAKKKELEGNNVGFYKHSAQLIIKPIF